MGVRLTDEAQRVIAVIAAETDVTPSDCLVEADRIAVVVDPEAMGTIIGPDGRTVRSLEETFGRTVTVIADAQQPAPFVANALAPAAVETVEIQDDDAGQVAVAVVDEADVGVAIGPDGTRVELARRLADRHFGIADVRVVSAADRKGSKDDA